VYLSPIFYQRVTDILYKETILRPIEEDQPVVDSAKEAFLTFEEKNALYFTAGYVPRALKKKLSKSAHPLKENLICCLSDMIDCVDDEADDDDDSQKWIEMIDRGGLTHVNSMAYFSFLSMELEIRTYITQHPVPNFKDVATAIKTSEDVKFYWCMLAEDWEEDESDALLELVVDMWITIRGFHYASAWLEKYKVEHKIQMQKSKGMRKILGTSCS
jgi:hypothetical protein